MDRLFDMTFYAQQWSAARAWAVENAVALSVATVGQILVVGLAFLGARVLSPRLKNLLRRASSGRFEQHTARIAHALELLAFPIVWLLLQWLSLLIETGVHLPARVINLVVSLLAAWVVIQLTASLVRDPVWSRFVAIVVWVIAALNILGLLAPTMHLLDSAAVNLGDLRVSALTIVKGVLSLALLVWLATLAARLLERRVTASVNLTPSLQVLIVKLLKIVLVGIAVVAALKTVGIDLTAFAVLTGAIGVGIGFGLQKAVSNFVSGITILLDKSIKPGDVIAVGDTYGRVASLGTRYVSVITRDATEYLIPNEDFVTQQVINWSYSSNQLRQRIPIGIAYKSDVRQAMAACLEAAAEVGRVLKEPKPVCLLKGFGDSSVDLELRFWVADPMNGLSNVKSDILLLVWDKFHAAGIEIPFPQRDVHFASPLQVNMAPGERRPSPGLAG